MRRLPLAVWIAALVAWIATSPATVRAGQVELVSRASSSVTPTNSLFSYDPSLSVSRNGRFTAFLSSGVDLVPGQVNDPPNNLNLFLYDRVSGIPVLLSHAADSPIRAVGASEAVVSADGRFVAFTSSAHDLVPGQVSGGLGVTNVYLYDRTRASTILVSRAGGSTEANGSSRLPVVSADGRYVAFVSSAANLVPGQADTNGAADVFLYDRFSGTIALVTHASGSTTVPANGPLHLNDPPAISPDGRYVAFASAATDLVAVQVDGNASADVFLYDRVSGAVALVSHASGSPAVAADAVSFLTLTPSLTHLAVTANGRVVYQSGASNLVAGQTAAGGLFLYDSATGANSLVNHVAGAPSTPTAGRSDTPSLSADGGSVVFNSEGTDLVAGIADGNAKADVFLYDVASGAISLVSHAAGALDTTGNGFSGSSGLSEDGQVVALASLATDLVPGLVKQNGFTDVFLWHRQTGAITLASHLAGTDTVTGSGYSWREVVSGDGRSVVFSSLAADFVPGDANGAEDVFLGTENAPVGKFFTLSPCRLLDTRQEGGALASGSHRPLPAAGVCGIPATATALALNVTAVQPTGAGFLTLHAADAPVPFASSLNFRSGQTLTNNGIVPLSDGTGVLTLSPVVTGSGTVDVVADVMGWFE